MTPELRAALLAYGVNPDHPVQREITNALADLALALLEPCPRLPRVEALLADPTG
ncbi:hypothetical protein ACIGO9_29845 [Nocardia asteroides]|uniref:hypothetical protein n=1 Tax=Nocardia asteroides TaxID=1824 RepID=UPI0037C7F951